MSSYFKTYTAFSAFYNYSLAILLMFRLFIMLFFSFYNPLHLISFVLFFLFHSFSFLLSLSAFLSDFIFVFLDLSRSLLSLDNPKVMTTTPVPKPFVHRHKQGSPDIRLTKRFCSGQQKTARLPDMLIRGEKPLNH